jgi:hypothetical protein
MKMKLVKHSISTTAQIFIKGKMKPVLATAYHTGNTYMGALAAWEKWKQNLALLATKEYGSIKNIKFAYTVYTVDLGIPATSETTWTPLHSVSAASK